MRRSGKGSIEYLVQTVYYRYYDRALKANTAVLIRDPLPLTHGKTALALFAAGLEFDPTLRKSGCQGIAIEHNVYDRAVQSALSRLHSQYHQAEASAAQPDPDGKSKELLELLTWDVSTPCGAHACHNALKWGMYEKFGNPELMKSLYLIIFGIRHSFHEVFVHLPKWSILTAKFVPEDALDDESVRYAMWQCLGLAPDLLDLVMQLGLQWDMRNSQLLLSDTWKD